MPHGVMQGDESANMLEKLKLLELNLKL